MDGEIHWERAALSLTEVKWARRPWRSCQGRMMSPRDKKPANSRQRKESKFNICLWHQHVCFIMICLCTLVNLNESLNTINKSLKWPQLQQQQREHFCFWNVNGNFHIVFPPPWAAVERNLPEHAVMTISNNNGSGRSEVYNWINSGLLTYKQVKLILNQHLEPHLSTQHNKKSNQKKSRRDVVGIWWLRFIRNSVTAPAQLLQTPKLSFLHETSHSSLIYFAH